MKISTCLRQYTLAYRGTTSYAFKQLRLSRRNLINEIEYSYQLLGFRKQKIIIILLCLIAALTGSLWLAEVLTVFLDGYFSGIN